MLIEQIVERDGEMDLVAGLGDLVEREREREEGGERKSERSSW